MNYSIRRDALPAAVLQMDEVCFPADYRVKLQDSLWWTVWANKEPVAYAGLRVCIAKYNVGAGFLCRVGVMPDHRGHGLQKRLLRVREKAARKLGLRKLVTYCVPWNYASINSLIGCGYRVYEPGSKYGGTGAIYLEKNL